MFTIFDESKESSTTVGADRAIQYLQRVERYQKLKAAEPMPLPRVLRVPV